MTSVEIQGFVEAMKKANGRKDFCLTVDLISYEKKVDAFQIPFEASSLVFIKEMLYGLTINTNLMTGIRCADVLRIETQNPKGIL